jgi:peptidoglycan/xylan/chitin deacetylase (PgdA/CDA1 family)
VRSVHWRGVLALTYHRIAAGECELLDPGVWSATPETFDAQARWLARNVEVIGGDEIDDALRRRGRQVLLTFDDGYRDNVELALPILRAHGLTATFFLTSGFLDGSVGAWWDEIAWIGRRAGAAPATTHHRILGFKGLSVAERDTYLDRLADETGAGRRPAAEAARDWMTWEQARDLRDAGMTIGAHTITHPLFDGLPAERQRAEIGGSVRRIEERIGSRVRLFAYPDGRSAFMDSGLPGALREAGIRHAFRNEGGIARAPGDLFRLPRLNIYHGYDPDRFRLAVSLPAAFPHG